MVASMCEEVQNPEREVPKAIVLSVAAAGITGVIYLIPILFVLPDVQLLLEVANGQPIGLLFKTVTGSAAGGFGLLFLILGILFFAGLGAYAANLQVFDLFLLVLLGLLGLMMRRFGLPVLPLILGVILGPLMEFRLREAMAISGGDVSGLWSEPLAIIVYVVVAIAVVAPFAFRRVRPDPAAVAEDLDIPAVEEEKVR